MTESRLRWPVLGGEAQTVLFPAAERRIGRGRYTGLTFMEVNAKRIINEVRSPGRLPSRFTINAFRGCSHACHYCFARPTHEFLGLDSGADFDTKIVVKVNAVELARAETAPGRWGTDSIAMGTNTDPYQPAEGKYRLTGGIVEVLAERRLPFSILTKSPLVLRDLSRLAAAAQAARVTVDFSVGTLDEEVWRTSEPGTPHPRKRLEAVEKLNAAGVPSGVIMGPVLPWLSDRAEQLEAVVNAAVAAGARYVVPIPLHLKPGVRDGYLDWLARHRPDLVDRYRAHYGQGSFLPASEQRRISALVTDMVERAGGRPARPNRGGPPTPPDTGRGGMQLSMW